MGNKLEALGELSKLLENELDFDFSVNEKYIFNLNEFERMLKKPFAEKDKMIFYRGERKNDISRPLVPTLLRNRELLLKDNQLVVDIDSKFLRDFFADKGQFLNVYEKLFSKVSEYRLYELCSFSQHYLNFSPFVDFTKSLYVALSFALKGKDSVDEDFVIYTAEIPNPDLRGLTTAAGIWATSGIGLAIGAGMYVMGITATVLFLIGVEVLNYFFKGISLRSMIVEFSTRNQDSLKEISALFSSKNFIISSYEMEEKTDASGNIIYYVTMVVKAKNMNEEGILLMLLHDFPEITVHRII